MDLPSGVLSCVLCAVTGYVWCDGVLIQLSACLLSLSLYAEQYSGAYKNPPVTMIVPDDNGVKGLIAVLATANQAVLKKVVGGHIIKGVWPPAKLAALKPGTPLATFTPAKFLTKVSAIGKFPILLKGGTKPVTITSLSVAPIYKGTFIVMYGASKGVPL